MEPIIYGIDNNSPTNSQINFGSVLKNDISVEEIINLDSESEDETAVAVSSILKRKLDREDEDYRPPKCSSRASDYSGERNSIINDADDSDSKDRYDYNLIISFL